jgi:hypothetical protein
LIDADQYAEEFTHFDKVTLYYYRIDDVLTEENEEVIEDVDDVVSLDALAKLDMQTSVWVRNEKLMIDYEIISLNASYSQKILGRKPRATSPRETYLKKQKENEDGK